ncbi:MAG: hypothetical protein ACYSUK_01495 [Planctomycetota bacterium]|jgi:hypothetical protein
MNKCKDKNNFCKRVAGWFYQAVNSRFGLEAGWVQSHISQCPRCQKRLASLGRVNLAFSLLRSQPHGVELLMMANSRAISVLKHSLRYSLKAEKLKKLKPEPKMLDKLGRYQGPLVSTAACIAILILMKTGFVNSAEKVQNESRSILKDYYARQVGQDMADEIFTS